MKKENKSLSTEASGLGLQTRSKQQWERWGQNGELGRGAHQALTRTATWRGALRAGAGGGGAKYDDPPVWGPAAGQGHLLTGQNSARRQE